MPAQTIWWTNPLRLIFFIIVPIFFIAAAMPSNYYVSEGFSDKWFRGASLAVAFSGLIAFSIGFWAVKVFSALYLNASAKGTLLPQIAPEQKKYRLCMLFVGLISISANLVVVSPILLNPNLLLNLLSLDPGSFYDVKDAGLKYPGITSLTNVASVFMILYASKPTLIGSIPSRGEKVALVCLTALVICRGFLMGERLAILEYAIPYVVVKLSFVRGRRRIARTAVIAPVLGLASVIILFLTNEYFRTWSFYSSQNTSFLEFSLDRLLGYYFTALNNGAGMAEFSKASFYGTSVLDWFYRFPYMKDIFPLDDIIAQSNEEYVTFLIARGNIEFNNESGIFVPFIDYGIFGGVLLWSVLGLITGGVYRGFCARLVFGFLLYPSWIIGILELPRTFYWGSSRYFPALALTIVCATLLQPRRSKFSQQQRRSVM